MRNITDIDDKIIRRAVENGETLSSLTGRFIAAMHEDEAALGIQRPDLEPRATQPCAAAQDRRDREKPPGAGRWSSNRTGICGELARREPRRRGLQ